MSHAFESQHPTFEMSKMRLPLVRLTVRRLMAVVAVMALLLWLIRRWETDGGVSYATGHVRIPLVFLISGADTGQPIEGAVIRLEDPDYLYVSIPPDRFELKTGRDGDATTLVELPFNETRGLPSGRLRFYRVVYPHWKIKIAAKGYRDVVLSFADYERRDRRFHEKAPPAPIVIRLRR
jgi:hypothetical protein